HSAGAGPARKARRQARAGAADLAPRVPLAARTSAPLRASSTRHRGPRQARTTFVGHDRDHDAPPRSTAGHGPPGVVTASRTARRPPAGGAAAPTGQAAGPGSPAYRASASSVSSASIGLRYGSGSPAGLALVARRASSAS